MFSHVAADPCLALDRLTSVGTQGCRLANVPRVSFISLQIVFKSPGMGSGAMLQQLKAFVVLAEDLNSGPSTHMVALVTACNSRIRRHQEHAWYISMSTKHSYA